MLLLLNSGIFANLYEWRIFYSENPTVYHYDVEIGSTMLIISQQMQDLGYNIGDTVAYILTSHRVIVSGRINITSRPLEHAVIGKK
jgi:hypothetical protein